MLAPLWRRALRAASARDTSQRPTGLDDADHELERQVDIHAFSPADLERFAAAGGFTDVSVRGEELVANWFGWFNRGLEATAVMKTTSPMWWQRYAPSTAIWGYLDRRTGSPSSQRLHRPSFFYNLLLFGRSPSSGGRED